MACDKITVQELLDGVFTSTNTQIKEHVVSGTGLINNVSFNIIGTVEDTCFGIDESLEMAKQVLALVQANNKDPIILLTNVIGQKLTRRDEWLGMYASFAHLLKCLHLARQNGTRIASLIYNQAIGGSFIAFGMMASRIFALKSAQLAVMWLEGMAKVTQIDIDVLRALSTSSPVFAPGVANFKKLGGIHEVISLDEAAAHLLTFVDTQQGDVDDRAQIGYQLGGRTKALDIINAIERL